MVTTEMAVVMVTFLAGFLMLVVYAGRAGQAANDVRSAAQEAARAGTLEGSPNAARTRAVEIATANLATSGVACANGLSVVVDTSDFGPGGTVGVTVTCTASLADVSSLALPGSTTYTGYAVEVIDTYLGVPSP